MSDLSELLGQSTIAANLMSRLATPNSRAWLRGPAGSGKTTIGRKVMSRAAQSLPTLWLSGDPGHEGTKYLALYRALAGTRSHKAVRDALKSSITAPLRAIPIVGATAAEFAKIAVAAQSDTNPEFLTPEQQDLLQGLQGVAGRFPLLIVVDDIGWLDADTAQLILNFRLPEIQAAYSFSQTVSILFIENQDAKASLDDSLIRQLRTPESTTVSRVTREEFPLVLGALGFEASTEKETVDAVYGIVQGHLEITKQIASTLSSFTSDNNLGRTDATSVMSAILSRRIAGNPYADDVQRLLCLAACVGTAFSEAEVRCAYKDDQTFPTALDIAVREQFLQSADTGLRFVHDVVRAAAEELGALNAQEMHEKLSECIKLLRPGDYSTRLKHARLAGNTRRVSELTFVVSLQAARGERVRIHLPPEDADELKDALDDACTAYQLMDEGDHRGAIARMMPYYTGEFGLIQGEVVALLALNHIKRRTPDACNAAANLLEHWLERREEPEIWQRLMSTLVGAWATCGDTDKATLLYTQLAESLARQSTGDPTARTRLEVLNRKADQFLTTEIATKHIQRAVAWFGPEDGSDVPRNAFEYTASLVNLSAAQFTVGKFVDASNTASSALSWIGMLRKRGLRTTEPYKALNNYVVSAFRASTETAAAASDALGVLLENTKAGWRLDRSLVAINRGALMLLADHTESARELLEAVWGHIVSEDLDRYYALYAASNLAVALALGNERERAKQLLEEAKPHLEAIPKWFRHAHKRRLEMMIRAVEDTTLVSALDFDAFPTRHRMPDSEQDAWWSIGRGLLISDIQVWSE